MNPFEYANAISSTSKDIWEEGVSESEYKPFLVNRTLSRHYDAIMFVQEMNMRPHISERMQYDFLRLTINPKKKRFAKKEVSNDEVIDLIQEAYNVSYKKAVSYSSILNNDDLEKLKSSLCKGGSGNAK